jgi:hypothetical protein
MSQYEEIKQNVDSIVNQVKSKVEELELQLSLGKADAEDWLEEEKKNSAFLLEKLKTLWKMRKISLMKKKRTY